MRLYFTGRCLVLIDVPPLGENTLCDALKGLHLSAMGNTPIVANVLYFSHCPEGATSISDTNVRRYTQAVVFIKGPSGRYVSSM